MTVDVNALAAVSGLLAAGSSAVATLPQILQRRRRLRLRKHLVETREFAGSLAQGPETERLRGILARVDEAMVAKCERAELRWLAAQSPSDRVWWARGIMYFCVGGTTTYFLCALMMALTVKALGLDPRFFAPRDVSHQLLSLLGWFGLIVILGVNVVVFAAWLVLRFADIRAQVRQALAEPSPGHVASAPTFAYPFDPYAWYPAP